MLIKEIGKEESFMNHSKIPNVFIQLLLFLGMYMLYTTLVTGIMLIYTGFKYITTDITFNFDVLDPILFEEQLTQFFMTSDMVLAQLFLGILAIILSIAFAKGILKRSLLSMGFTKEKIALHYMIGLVVGVILFGSAVLIGTLMGSLEFKGYILNNQWGLLLLFFIGFIIQGMSEEVMIRGYLMPSLATKIPMRYAVLISSLVFAALHLLNPGMNVIAFINLTLFGIFAGVYMCKTHNIWGVCAIHTIWNFVQGNFFGILVSGMDMDVSVFRFKAVPKQSFLNGGSFGLEGGITVTIVLLIACGLITLYKKEEPLN